MKPYICDCFLQVSSSVETNRLRAECQRRGRDVRKCWVADQRIVGCVLFMGFDDNRKKHGDRKLLKGFSIFSLWWLLNGPTIVQSLSLTGKADISTCTFPWLDNAKLSAVTQLCDKHLTQIVWQSAGLNLPWCCDSGLSEERVIWCDAVLINLTCQWFLLEWSFCWHTAVKATFLQHIKHSCEWITKSRE